MINKNYKDEDVCEKIKFLAEYQLSPKECASYFIEEKIFSGTIDQCVQTFQDNIAFVKAYELGKINGKRKLQEKIFKCALENEEKTLLVLLGKEFLKIDKNIEREESIQYEIDVKNISDDKILQIMDIVKDV